MPRAKAMKECVKCGELKSKHEAFGYTNTGRRDTCLACEAEAKARRLNMPILTRWVCGPYAEVNHG